MQPAQVIVLATPVFLLMMAVELAIAYRKKRKVYRWHDALSSVGLGIVSQVVGLGVTVFTIGIYTWVFDSIRVFSLSTSSWWVWPVGLVLYDFCYYWLHRMGHELAVLWAAHVVHHQSEDYNLSTALRQTSSGWLLGWIFYIPMAVLGFPPLVFAIVGLVDLLYQFWVHTELVGKLGWFDRVFCSPSNHRAHHAVNDRYLDKNYGGIFILFDRWFGTFVEEDDGDPVVYGTRSPLRSFNPLWANLEVYWALAREANHCPNVLDKIRLLFKPPGWRPTEVAQRWPKPAFDLDQARQRYDPPLTAGLKAATVLAFLAAMVLTTWLLWNAHELDPAVKVGAAVLIGGAMLLVGWLSERRSGFGPAPR